MAKGIQSIRGMHDVLPLQTPEWQFVESELRTLMQRYGYSEIRMPIVENTALFKRAVGEVTDIVEKEMYTFDDRNGDSLSLRPEGTASCVRAGIEHGLLYNQQQRLWYMGPMFRHERPQKGRYRQFHQIGVETFGFSAPDMDAELIMMIARFWAQLGLSSVMQLEINSLGSSEARAAYRSVLIDYFESNIEQMDEEAKHRLHSNPLRILDSKNPDMQAIVEAAPKLKDYLDEESATEFAQLKGVLDAVGISYIENDRLVRGLDYYNKCVFEWTTDKLGAQGTVCAGGRFDGLVEQLGGRATPAAGFAMGLERLIALLEETDNLPAAHPPQVVIMAMGKNEQAQAMQIAERLRDENVNVVYNSGGGSMKSQMKRADKSGARFALILGEREATEGIIAIKDLRQGQEQKLVKIDALVDTIQAFLGE